MHTFGVADDRERPLDLTAEERAQIADMMARRGVEYATGRLEVEIVRGRAIGGWLHVKFGGSTTIPRAGGWQ